MRKLMQAALLLTLSLGFVGCSSIAPATDNDDSSVQQTEIRLGDAMMIALQTGDYAKFSRDFSKELKESVTENAFRKIRSDLEERQESIARWTLLDTLDRGGLYRTEVWKITLEKNSKSGKIGIERLFYVTKANLDGKTKIIGFRFDALF
ncbi:MAG: hypothetical protein LBM70_02180 [Victivallales bacterium]|jgi:hypothetical protein|nr:hypothetical protein [Victivallales bacterium]